MNRTYQEILVSCESLVEVANRGGWYLTKRVIHGVGGNLTKEQWFKDGEFDREGAPASISYSHGRVFPGDNRTFEQLQRDGSVSFEWWLRHGKCHREDGPGRVFYYTDGSLEREVWYRHGKVHRDDGPAGIRYYSGYVFLGDTRTLEELEREGAVECPYWYFNGKEVQRFK